MIFPIFHLSQFSTLDTNVVKFGLISLILGAVLRILATAAIAFGDKLNVKEKFFVGFSWMAKASVQAALGPVALRNLKPDDPDRVWAEMILMLCILSIVLTAPVGAVIISIAGPRLLTKTKPPGDSEAWRRSHRPSIRDISLNDEGEFDPYFADEDAAKVADVNTTKNTKRNQVV